MPLQLQGLLTLLGRVLLCSIFLLSAVGYKIYYYSRVVDEMTANGVPAPQEFRAVRRWALDTSAAGGPNRGWLATLRRSVAERICDASLTDHPRYRSVP